MLDPLPINEKETRELKCDLCGCLCRNDIECEVDDYECIDEFGRCRDCYEEYGEDWPDRI